MCSFTECPESYSLCSELKDYNWKEIHWAPLTTSNFNYKNVLVINGTHCNIYCKH